MTRCKTSLPSFCSFTSALFCSLVLMAPAAAPATGAAQGRKSGSAPPRRPMTQADVEKLWTSKSDALLNNEIRLRGLAFTVSGYWLQVELPKASGVPIPEMATAASALRRLIPSAPDLDSVAKEAPDLMASLKSAAQKHSDAEMQTLVDSSLMANKAGIYELFDNSHFRASSLGKPALDEHGDVGLPFFELTTGNVEQLHYLLLSKPKGRLIVEDIVTGPERAELYLHDEEQLANKKLETMFRALNDGDQTGLKDLCTPGLYSAIQEWGGKAHPGDRLTQSHSFRQVTAQSSVPLDQKSIRVVTKISYPLPSGPPITFFVDFERVGNELKVVRLRDDANKVIVYDPNIDNYVNDRYGLPHTEPPTEVAMTDNPIFLSSSAQIASMLRVLQNHDKSNLLLAAKSFVSQNPTIGEGYGYLAAAELMDRKGPDAARDGLKALEKNGTAYFLLERHAVSLTGGKPFTLSVLGISKDKIDYLPQAGTGSRESIDLSSVKISIEKGTPFLRSPRPFLKLEFKGSDGKGKTYNFADYGTICAADKSQPHMSDLIEEQGSGVCGAAATTPTTASKSPLGQLGQLGQPSLPVLTPQAWREDLGAVIQVVNSAKAGHK